MRVITLNVNGIRSAASKGFFKWLAKQQADIVCLQETKAQEHQLPKEQFIPSGYYAYFHDAEKKGYSGVALYTRKEPDKVIVGLGWPDVDAEARYIEARFGKLSVVSLYLPSGSSGEHRQAVKFDVLKRLVPVLKKMRKSKREYIICGDWNIAHKNIDLKNWRSNQKNSGFLPEERAWITRIIENGYVDTFRALHPDQRDAYTYWDPWRERRARNIGWRIDYVFVSQDLMPRVRRAFIQPEVMGSDHCPVGIELEL